ncbi:MAG: YdjY domain-containing protein [Planctomycetota bacterium]|jgi:hypothetical protein
MRRLALICLVTATLGACVAQDTTARVVHPFEGVTVRLASRTVEVEAWTCRDSGAIIQVACAANTREHESLLVVAPQPSEIHAALHMAGFEAGSPGRWIRLDDQVRFIPPTGAAVDVSVRCERWPGEVVEEPVSHWLRHADDVMPFPGNTWIFGGSHLVETPAWVGGDTQLAADLTGSVIGLTTFGDEVLGLPQGLADPTEGKPAPWAIRTPQVPPIGTPVTLVLRPAAEGG